jgi:hypothetical protein
MDIDLAVDFNVDLSVNFYSIALNLTEVDR